MDTGDWVLFWSVGGLFAAIIAADYRLGIVKDSPVEFSDWSALFGLLVATVSALFERKMPLLVENGGLAAWLAWTIWSRRPPRKRRESKVLGRIRDLGHRLVVSN